MKTSFLIAILAILMLTRVNAQNVTVSGVQVSVTSETSNASGGYDLSTCKESFVTFHFNNTTASAVSNFKITTQTNTAVLVLYGKIVDPNVTVDAANSSMTLQSLPVGLSTLQIPIVASCSNFLSTTHQSSSTLTFTYNLLSQTQNQSIAFNISSGVIGYVASDDAGDNLSLPGYRNDSFTRRYNFIVSENSFSGIIHLEEVMPNAPGIPDQWDVTSLELRVKVGNQYTQLSVESGHLVDPITKKIIRDFSLSNILNGQEIEILETVQIVGCPAGTSVLTITYGCANSFCTTPLRDHAQNIVYEGPNKPHLTITDLNPSTFDACPSSANNKITRRFRLINDGNATANNVSVRLMVNVLKEFPLNIVPNSSVVLTGFPSQVQSRITFTDTDVRTLASLRGLHPDNLGAAPNSSICFQDDLMLLIDKTINVISLDPGQYIDVEWQEQTCCVSNNDNNYSLSQYILNLPTCDNQCAGTTTFNWLGTNDRAEVYGFNQSETSGITNMFGCMVCPGGCGNNPAGSCTDQVLNNPTASQDYTESVSLDLSSLKLFPPNDGFALLPIDYNHYRIVVDLAAEGRLLLAPETAPTGRGNIVLQDGNGNSYHPLSQTVLSPSEITSLFGATDIPSGAIDAGTRAVFEFDPAIVFPGKDLSQLHTFKDGLSIDQLQSFLNSLKLSFELSGVCNRSSINQGASNWYNRIYFVPDSDDCPDCRLSIGDKSHVIIVNCPGCVFPGVLVNGYEIERQTVGEADVDNNGLRDLPGTIATGTPNLRMVTDNDIFKTTSSAVLWAGTTLTYGSGSSFGTLENASGFSHRFLTNLGKLDMMTSYGDFMEVVVDAAHPIVLDYSQNGKTYHLVFTDNTNNIWTTNNHGNFLFQFPIALIRQQLATTSNFTGNATTFNYEAGDASTITSYYRVRPGFDMGTGVYYENIDVSNRVFYTNQLKDVNIGDEGNQQSPYGISGALTSSQGNQLEPYFNYICESYGGGFTLADLKEGFEFEGSNATCQKPLIMRQYSSANPNNSNDYKLDLFPFEIRTFNRVNSMRFVLPQGYDLDLNNSYLRVERSFRETGKFNYTGFAEMVTLANLNPASIRRLSDAFENFQGTPHRVGDLFEVDFSYNAGMTYRDNAIPTTYTPTSPANLFDDYNEFSMQELVVALTVNCNHNPLGYILYADNPSYIQSLNDFITYFNIQGPKAYTRPYDATNQTFGGVQEWNNTTSSASFSSPGAALWNNPAPVVATITKTVANVNVFKKTNTVPFLLTAGQGANDANLFMYFTTKNNKTILGDLIKTNPNHSNTIINMVNGVYQLGAMNPGDAFNFNLEVAFICNAIKDDEIYIHVGSMCGNAYPTFINGTLSATPCNQTDETIRIIESDANMSLAYTNNTTCTGIAHQLNMISLQDGGLYDFKPTVQLPSNSIYKLGTAKLQPFEIVGGVPVAMKDAQGQNILFTLPDPTISSNTLTWDLTNLVGLDDIYLHGGGYASLTFESTTPCGQTSGVVDASATATTYCSQVITKNILSPVTITYPTGCTTCCSANASAGLDQQGCFGSYTLTALNIQSGYTYTWTDGTTTLTGSTVTVNPPAGNTTVYTLTVTSDANNTCFATDQVSIQVFAAPTLNVTTADGLGSVLIPTCHSQVVLNATTGYVNYTWKKDGVLINGANTASYTVNMGEAGTYKVEVTDVNGCKNSHSINVIDGITISGDNQICPGEQASLTVTMTGVIGQYLVQWFKDGSSVTTPQGIAGSYYALVVLPDLNPTCTLQTAAHVVTELPLPSTYTITGGDINFCPSDYPGGVWLTGTAPSSTPTPITQWSWNTGATVNSIVVNNAGTYSIHVLGANGCSNSSSTTLVAPTIGINQICNPDGSTLLTASSNVSGVVGYTWTNNFGATIGTGSSITVTQDGIYHVTSADLRCYTNAQTNVCRNTSAASLLVREDFNITGITDPCTNHLIQTDLTCVNPGVSMTTGTAANQWIGKTRITSDAANEVTNAPGLWTGTAYPNASDASDVYFLASDGHITSADERLWFTTVNVENCATYSFRAMVKNLLTVQAQELPQVYLKVGTQDLTQSLVFTNSSWKQLGGVWKSNITGPIQIAVVLKSGGFVGRDIGLDQIVFTKVDCSDRVTPNCNAIADVGIGKYICAGGSIQIGNNITTAGLSYSWSVNNHEFSTIMNPVVSPTVTTEYTLTVTDAANQCTATDKVTVSILSPSIAISITNRTQSSTEFTASYFNGMGSAQYAWFINGTQILINTTGVFTTSTIKAGDKVTCKLLTACTQQPLSNEITILASDVPCLVNKSVCYGSSVQIGCPSVAGTTYSWNPTAGLSDATISSPNAFPMSTTTYTLTTTVGAAVTTAQVTVTVNNKPVVAAVSDRSTLCSSEVATLSANITTPGLAPYTYVWKQGTTTIGTTPTVAVSPTSNVTYGVMITDANGCVSNNATVNVAGNINPPIQVNSVSSSTLCIGSQFSVGFFVASCASINSGNVYTIELSDATGSFTNPVVLTTMAISVYGTFNASVTVPNNTLPGTNYRVRVKSSSLPFISAPISTPITIGQSPVITSAQASPNTVCSGATVNFQSVVTGGVSPYTYNWTIGGTSVSTSSQFNQIVTSTTNATLQVTGNNGCYTLLSNIYATVNPNPVIAQIVTSPGTICAGESSSLTVTSVTGGTAPYNYLWKQGTTVIGTTSSVTVSPSSTTSYNVTVTDNKGCSANASGITVTNNGSAAITTTTVTPLTMCSGSTVSVTFTINGCASYLSGNVFTAQLSDASGSFTNPVSIGTLTSTTQGTISATIPTNTLPVANYRIRVVSSNQSHIGTINSSNISISTNCGALSFDGVDDRIIIPNNSANNLGTTFTIELWIKASSSSNTNSTLLSTRNTTSSNTFQFSVTASGTKLVLSLNGSTYISNAFTNIYDNNCHHVAVTGGSSNINFLVDGVAKGSSFLTSPSITSNPLLIGYDLLDGNLSAFKGIIDDVRIWNISRNTSSIAADMIAYTPGNTTGLKGSWSINEGSGQTVYDGSLTQNNGSLGTVSTLSDAQDPSRVAAVSCASPVLSNGLLFDGTDDRAEIPNNASYPTTGDFTMEAWVQIPSTQSTSNYPTILSKRSSALTDGFIFAVYGGTKLLFQCNGNNYYNSNTFASIYDNNCHHLAVTRTAGAFTFYVDGIAQTGNPVGNGSIASTRPIWIGADFPAASNGFKGNINEIRIWDQAKTATEIANNKSIVLASGTAHLVGYWKFKEATAEVLYDAGSLANNGFLGSNSLQFDAQNPTNSSVACYTGDKYNNPDEISTGTMPDSTDLTEDRVYIYPNPFEQQTTIMVSGKSNERSHVRFTDLNGRTLEELDVNHNVETTVARHFPAGVYIIEITGDHGRSIHKIVKVE